MQKYLSKEGFTLFKIFHLTNKLLSTKVKGIFTFPLQPEEEENIEIMIGIKSQVR